ncbi:2-C-methyl-D-erythritol 4-phosphate cytidylyltransferase [bacterium]|nr:2-C-methyl-D-erythritol 4-phosphate cytidylyltransferase [bacterium]
MPSVAAIVVAAGSGSRLGAGLPKAFVTVGGVPLVVRSLRALLAVPAVDEAIVVAPPDDLPETHALLNAHGPFRRRIEVVAGGVERQDSVRHGLAAVTRAELVAIHDAARPFVAPATVAAAIAAAHADGAAIVALPAVDTVKIVDARGFIESTPPRGRTWLAQTPQVFRTDLIRAAHRQPSDGGPATDDAALVERLGHRVRVVAGSPDNRKITTPEDRAWAEWYLARPATPR